MTHLSPLYPPALKKGDTIGVMSTSSCLKSEKDVIKAREFMEAQGYKVKIHPQTFKQFHQSAGTAEEKVEALHELFADSDVKAIFSARGGNRASLMLDKIDFNLIKQNPKIFIGYSDLTILLNAIYKQTGLVTFHGSTFHTLHDRSDYQQMIDVLSGHTDNLDLSDCTILQDGNAEGTIIGGNLSVFQALLGTPYLPEMENAILLIEDVGDHLSRYDRMLCHFKNAGILSKISALIVGSFTDVEDNPERPFGFSLKDIISEHTKGLNIPILMDAPFGHGDRLCTLPIGAQTILKNGTLSFKPLA